jgi:hypothetical protein
MTLPKYLYKYRDFDQSGRNIRMLSHNEIFFSSPAKFNDPFDCQIPINIHEGTREKK